MTFDQSSVGLSVIYNPGAAFDYLGASEQVTQTLTCTVLECDGTSETRTVTVTVTGNWYVITATAAADTLTGTSMRGTSLALAGNDTEPAWRQ